MKNRENSHTVLSEAQTTYLIYIKCVDSQNQGETGTLTVTVIHNQGPTLVALAGNTAVQYFYSLFIAYIYTVMAMFSKNLTIFYNDYKKGAYTLY